ncbi:MAG: nitroreductase family protein [Oscillospiraceae bacterium]|nr:nitroreductase family protein [Oscillospiraceae bacterium]
MSKKSRKTILIWALSLLPLLATMIAWGFLPEEIPVHWNSVGPDGYADNSIIWLFASLGAFMAILFTILPLIDPNGKNYQRFIEYYEIFTLVVVGFFAIITGIILSESFRPGQLEVGLLIVLMVGLLFLVIGNLMPKLKKNYFIGIRNPWTLSDSDIWNRTHRLGGIIFFVFGLCLTLWALMPVWPWLIYLVSALALVTAIFVPYIYSYYCFRQKQKREQTVAAKETDDAAGLSEVMKNLLERRSIRAYTDEVLSHAQLEQLVLAGQYAPSGKNLQEWHFVVVENREVLGRLEQLIGKALNRPNYNFYGAPVIILCANKKGARNAMADCSAALQNMMLAASDMGLGTCWINQFRDVWEDDEMNAYLAEIGLPEGYQVQCSTIVGYPAQNPEAPARKQGTVTYVK